MLTHHRWIRCYRQSLLLHVCEVVQVLGPPLLLFDPVQVIPDLPGLVRVPDDNLLRKVVHVHRVDAVGDSVLQQINK